MTSIQGRGTCTWEYDDARDYWETSCGEAFQLVDGTPADNGMRFCPHCGHRLACAVPGIEVHDGVEN